MMKNVDSKYTSFHFCAEFGLLEKDLVSCKVSNMGKLEMFRKKWNDIAVYVGQDTVSDDDAPEVYLFADGSRAKLGNPEQKKYASYARDLTTGIAGESEINWREVAKSYI